MHKRLLNRFYVSFITFRVSSSLNHSSSLSGSCELSKEMTQFGNCRWGKPVFPSILASSKDSVRETRLLDLTRGDILFVDTFTEVNCFLLINSYKVTFLMIAELWKLGTQRDSMPENIGSKMSAMARNVTISVSNEDMQLFVLYFNGSVLKHLLKVHSHNPLSGTCECCFQFISSLSISA